MKLTKSKLRKIIKEEIELESLRNAIRKTVREMDFKDKESFKKYKSQHKMRPTTKINIAGKETTVSAALPGDEAEGQEDWTAYMKAHPDEVFQGSGVDYDKDEMTKWTKNAKAKIPKFKNTLADTLSDVAKYDSEARVDDIMNSHGLSAVKKAAAKELHAAGESVPKYEDGDLKYGDLPLYKEIEYMAKKGTTPEKMKKLFKGSTDEARKYWYLKLGLRSPEQIPHDDAFDKTGKPPSFKESIIPQMKLTKSKLRKIIKEIGRASCRERV